MKKAIVGNKTAKRGAKAAGASSEQMDRAVTDIILALRNGQAARLPGLGTLLPGKPWTFEPERNEH